MGPVCLHCYLKTHEISRALPILNKIPLQETSINVTGATTAAATLSHTLKLKSLIEIHQNNRINEKRRIGYDDGYI